MVEVVEEVTGIETVAGRDPVTAVEIEIGTEGATGEATEETGAGIAEDLLPLARVLDWATEVTTAARPVEVATGATAEIEVEIEVGTGAVIETDGVGPAGTAVSVAVEATGTLFKTSTILTARLTLSKLFPFYVDAGQTAVGLESAAGVVVIAEAAVVVEVGAGCMVLGAAEEAVVEATMEGEVAEGVMGAVGREKELEPMILFSFSTLVRLSA